MEFNVTKKVKLLLISVVIVTLSGCFATRTVIKKRDLEIKTRMAETIFLEPVSEDKKIIYVKIGNTSGKNSLNLEDQIKASLIKKGYRITGNPVKAKFILQANILQAGKNNNEESLRESFGDAAVPGILGGAIGKNSGGDTGAIIGAVTGATVGFIGSNLVQDVTYSIITDIEIKQKVDYFTKIAKNKDDNIDANGWKKLTTRVVSYANKVNLKYEEAEPELVSALVSSVTGIF
jgi:hypothetical protein